MRGSVSVDNTFRNFLWAGEEGDSVCSRRRRSRAVSCDRQTDASVFQCSRGQPARRVNLNLGTGRQTVGLRRQEEPKGAPVTR